MIESPTMRDLLLKLCRREDLTRDEARTAMLALMSGQASDAQIGGFLIGMAAKGTTVDEIVGAATVLREKVIPIPCEGSVVDTCGTGGDMRQTFNVSTAAALIAAAAGVRVVKHGNRSASGKNGAADVLEKLGVQLQATPSELADCLVKTNICFAFARLHHPAMKYVAEARKSLNIPTFFNVLAPLTNPGRARRQVLGVFAPELTDRLAGVLRELGSHRAWVVHGDDGMDEISTLGPTRVSELVDHHIHTWTLDPRELGSEYARLSDLQVNSLEQAADALLHVLDGHAGPMRDIGLLNAAAALMVAGEAEHLPGAMELATQAVDSGRARQTLNALVERSQQFAK